VAELNQYLRITFNGTGALLPSGASAAIEQRDALTPNAGRGKVTAWRTHRGRRLPAYCLDQALQPVRRDDWVRAIFLDGVGLVVDEIQMLGRTEASVQPFTPLGPAPTPVGHLYNGAWVEGQRATLVLDPRALVAYLQGLGE